MAVYDDSWVDIVDSTFNPSLLFLTKQGAKPLARLNHNNDPWNFLLNALFLQKCLRKHFANGDRQRFFDVLYRRR